MYDTEIEQQLLGAILINNEAVRRIPFLKAEHFHDELHGRIYTSILKMIEAGRRATPITLRSMFPNDKPFADMTVPQYLGQLAAGAVAVGAAEDYGRLIYDMAMRRKLTEIGQGLIDGAATDSKSGRKIAEGFEEQLAKITDPGKSDDTVLMADALTEVIDAVAGAYQREDEMAGLSTGLRDLDKQLGGLSPTDLVILAGRPSMGKTALAVNMAAHNAKLFMRGGEQGCPVGFFSLEMSAAQLVMRQVAELAGISSHRMRRGAISSQEFDTIIEASQQLSDVPLYIDQTAGLSINQIIVRARRMKRQRNVGLIVVDYLQLLSSTGKENRQVEISEITTGLKALAKDIGVPVLALSQLSRAVEQRKDKRPQLSDLRESGAIEQDADIVLMVFREEYYHSQDEVKVGAKGRAEWELEHKDMVGVAEIIIGKQRHGPTGTVEVHFNAELTKFSDLARDTAQGELKVA